MSDEEFANSAVHYVLAKASADRVADYVMRGRRLKGMSTEKLQIQFENTFRAYVANSANRTANDDVVAEFDLRGIEPSFLAIRPDFEKLKERTRIAASAPDAELTIGGSIVDDYLEGRRTRQ